MGAGRILADGNRLRLHFAVGPWFKATNRPGVGSAETSRVRLIAWDLPRCRAPILSCIAPHRRLPDAGDGCGRAARGAHLTILLWCLAPSVTGARGSNPTRIYGCAS